MTAATEVETSNISTDRGASPRDWVALVRPQQWVKNLFVLAPLLFSGQLLDTQAVVAALSAFAIFCLLASGVYLINDVTDVEADRARHRAAARWTASR